MFRELPPNTKTPVNCTLANGGIGDLLASLMTVNYIINKAPWINLLIWCPNYLKDFAKHVLPKDSIIRNYTEAEKKYDANKLGISTQWKGQHTPMRTQPVRYAFHVLCDYSPTIEETSYLKIRPEEINISQFDLPEKYIAIQAAYTEQVKTMPVETFNKITDYILEKGYTPVYLGKSLSESGKQNINVKASIISGYNLSKGINLVDKTDLLQTAAIISKSKALVCMDGGLLHLGGFTDTPIIAGVTFVNAKQVAPIRDGIEGKNCYFVEPDDSLKCKGCQSNWTLLYNHDFRNCYYKDYACVSHMKYEKFKEQLDKVI